MFAARMKQKLLGFCVCTLLLTGQAWPVAGNELPVSSPFFRPYEGDFSLEWGVGYKFQSSSLAIAALDSARETATKELSTAMALNYGLSESFYLGVSGKYMLYQDYRLTQSGVAFVGKPGANLINQGFYEPGFHLGARLLGTRSEEWFINLDLRFQPGLNDANNAYFSVPNNQYQASMLIGRDFEAWAIGIVSVMQYYSPSALDTNGERNDQVLSTSEVFAQVNADFLYLRASAGIVKFLDRRSNESAVKKKTFPTGQLEIGFPFTDTCVLSTRLSYVAGAQDTMKVAGFDASLVAQPVWVGSASVVVAF
jgi:hypothetical protein